MELMIEILGITTKDSIVIISKSWSTCHIKNDASFYVFSSYLYSIFCLKNLNLMKDLLLFEYVLEVFIYPSLFSQN